jgi:hypothetical protein
MFISIDGVVLNEGIIVIFPYLGNWKYLIFLKHARGLRAFCIKLSRSKLWCYREALAGVTSRHLAAKENYKKQKKKTRKICNLSWLPVLLGSKP